MDEISATATSAIEEVREIAHNLRPYELDRLGLVAAIESMIGRVADSTSINLSADLERIDGLLSLEAETSVYRIVQEGLNNVVKHSTRDNRASRNQENVGQQLVITVQDNGQRHVAVCHGAQRPQRSRVSVWPESRSACACSVVPIRSTARLHAGRRLTVRLESSHVAARIT